MPKSPDRDIRLVWSRKLPLRHRILAVNIFAILIFAGSILYLDSFRSRLTQARIEQAEAEARMSAHALAAARPEAHDALLTQLGRDSGTRLRIFTRDGRLVGDGWLGSAPTYEMRDPAQESWWRDLGRWLDNAFDAVVGARQPPELDQRQPDSLNAWPEAQLALQRGGPVSQLRRAPEGTAFVSAAAPISEDAVLLLTVNARDVRRVVRAERLTLGLIITAAITLSVLLSLFLARTIAVPLRRLALAAHRVRLGRAREVDVPLLPERRDEIGLLARALHDMTGALRSRIDATEAFAADVTHELKNPLASLRSAVDTLERVEDPALRRQMLHVVRDDVMRLDRLVVEIAEASRLDAELSRSRFEPVDIGALINAMLPAWEARAPEDVRLAFARPASGSTLLLGDESRLARLLDNLVDNALSFSPPAGLVNIRARNTGMAVEVSVEDDGPGVPPDAREAIFRRFHSVRPDQDFGRHSGLGLAIAKAISEAHDGRIRVEDRTGGRHGARFVVTFPLAQP